MKTRKRKNKSVTVKRSLFERTTNYLKKSYFIYGILFTVLAFGPLLALIRDPNARTVHRTYAVVQPYQGWLIFILWAGAAIWFFVKAWIQKKNHSQSLTE